MEKITFKDLNLTKDTSTKSFDYNGKHIDVLQYLPIEDKISLISIALQNSEEEDIYNQIKLDMYFHLFIILSYTNIEFSEEDREDYYNLYDRLKTNKILDSVLSLMPEEEYEQLYEYLNETVERKTEAKRSMTSLINKFINDLPKQAEAMKNILDTFDKEKYQEVVDFAKAANGGRDIN